MAAASNHEDMLTEKVSLVPWLEETSVASNRFSHPYTMLHIASSGQLDDQQSRNHSGSQAEQKSPLIPGGEPAEKREWPPQREPHNRLSGRKAP